MLLWLGIKFIVTSDQLNCFSNETLLIIFQNICIQLCIDFLLLYDNLLVFILFQ